MTDERDKSSRTHESLARTTARDVPFVRDAGSDAEPAPRGQRPEQLPRDPTYEAELAQVELAVLRDPERREDPSTKQTGRRRAAPIASPPESVTPESPQARPGVEVWTGRSPKPPSSGGRAVASGTLLSVGAVDPRGKTERTLDAPRMFFSQPDARGEAYFKPGKIPAVTVHQTLETETVKLADSIDPRRAKTMPRIDRAALARYVAGEAESDGLAESAAPLVLAGPGSEVNTPPMLSSESYGQDDFDAASVAGGHVGQIHASLSPFREHVEEQQPEPSFSADPVPTRAEPLAARRLADEPASLPPPDTNAIPTHRDLPQHRIEASLPPPPPVPSVKVADVPDSVPTSARAPSAALSSEMHATATSINAQEPSERPAWVNFAAFGIALLVTIVLGLWLTKSPEPEPGSAAPPAAAALPRAPVKRVEPPPVPVVPESEMAPSKSAAPPVAEAAPRKASSVVTATAVPVAPAAPVAAPRKAAAPKITRETIF